MLFTLQRAVCIRLWDTDSKPVEQPLLNWIYAKPLTLGQMET